MKLFGRKKKVAPKVMSEAEMWDFINQTCRAEADENRRVYLKAIRVSLDALGYDRDWLNSTFRNALEYYYDSSRLTGSLSLADTIRQYNARAVPEV